MRLEDWQKWLDTQFIDPGTVPPEPQPVVVVAEAEIEPAVIDSEPVTPDVAPPVPREIDVPSRHEAQADSDIPTQRQAPALVDDVELPSIEKYLPFLKSSSTVDQRTPSLDAADVRPVRPEPPAPIPATEVNIGPAEPQPAPSGTVPVTRTGEDAVAAAPDPTPPVVDNPTTIQSRSAATQTEQPAAETLPIPDTEGAHRMVRRVATGHHRSRPSKHADPAVAADNLGKGGLWELVPRHIQTLVALGSDEVTQNSYKREFRESRIDLIGRILDPTLSLEETARLLNVCPTTVRRYTNRGMLTHQRTQGDQRRFKLSDVLAFLESQSRADKSEVA